MRLYVLSVYTVYCTMVVYGLFIIHRKQLMVPVLLYNNETVFPLSTQYTLYYGSGALIITSGLNRQRKSPNLSCLQ